MPRGHSPNPFTRCFELEGYVSLLSNWRIGIGDSEDKAHTFYGCRDGSMTVFRLAS